VENQYFYFRELVMSE